MTPQRKFRVTTTISQCMWACSRDDAEKYQEELIRKGKLDALRNGVTEVRYCFTGGENFVEAPEDISKTRNPVEEPRQGDWLEIDTGAGMACALVRRLSRRKVYYYDALSRTERTVDRERWIEWASKHRIHPSYDGIVPTFIVDEVVKAHEARGMLRGFNATADSSLILEILDSYGFVPDDYEVENGYWAEVFIDQVISERILADHAAPRAKTGTAAEDEIDDFSVGFSQELPTLDEFEGKL